jgi:hypothetical protein
MMMMEAVRTSETSVDNHFTRQYIPEYNSEHHKQEKFINSPTEGTAVTSNVSLLV